MLEHSAKEVFEVYYLPLQGYYLYHKKSRIDLIYDTLTAFMDNDIHWLDNNLNKTTHENKRIRKDVLTQSFIYEVTPQRLWSAIGMTLATGLTLGVLFI